MKKKNLIKNLNTLVWPRVADTKTRDGRSELHLSLIENSDHFDRSSSDIQLAYVAFWLCCCCQYGKKMVFFLFFSSLRFSRSRCVYIRLGQRLRLRHRRLLRLRRLWRLGCRRRFCVAVVPPIFFGRLRSLRQFRGSIITWHTPPPNGLWRKNANAS